ncbi:lytic transglycosylase domain-containing protein [Burkholderia ambifaria]|uniref:lytic transglycosylase domain-containing protein n=1 Tax=Burkholderia ambifaria TaxID=152480 RepID=UPI001BA4123D|nr:lytic transglycosylase domain-containing protein [Burkholderia ambifaria]MBR8343081.1 lytic transglycosylase domain-containing protein [Burkholderia ambifaria]
MAGLFDGDPTGGLMAAFANPQTAGLLGMAGGLLQAAGPSRIPVSMGQAFGAGLQGMGQGVGNAFQTQQQLLRMRAMQGLMGGDTGQPGAQPQSAPSYSSMFGPASTAPGMMPQTSVAAPNTFSATAQTSGASIYGRSPQQLFQQGMLMNMADIKGGGDLMRIAVEHDPSLAAMMPTDITKMGVQGGMSPANIQAANAAGVAKSNYIAPVNARPGAILRNPLTMQPMAYNPNIPAGGTPVFDASGNVVGINQIPGAADVTGAMAAAKAGGEGSVLPFTEGKDASGNPLPIMSRTAAATQGAGVPGFTPFQNAIRQVETNGNMNAVNPASGAVGSMQVTKTGAGSQNPGFGVRPAANNSPAELQRVGADYAGAMQQHYGNDTDAAVAYNWGPQNADKWIAAGRPWKMLPPETRNYVGQVHAQMQNFSGNGQGAQPQGGAIYAAPPMGATAMSNEAQAASAKVMADDYQNMQGVRQNAPAVLQAYDHLLGLAKTGGWEGWAANGGLTGKLMSTDAATYASPSAAEYDKTRAFLVNSAGAALGQHNTDAARANADRMIPEFGKPTQAKIDGIMQARNQTAMAALRANVMTPLFQAGDSKAYTSLANQFDTTIKPETMPTIAPIMQMSGPQQQAAVQAAIKANPSLRPSFEMLFNAGMLK